MNEEVKIYEKLLKQSALARRAHCAAHARRRQHVRHSVPARAVQEGRHEPDEEAQAVRWRGRRGLQPKDVRELQEETVREGMDGISPRYVINRLSTALVKDGVTCINPIDALRALRDGLEQHTCISREERERLLNLIAEARKEYDEMAKREVQRAFVYSFEESAHTLLNNYLDNVEAFCNKHQAAGSDHRRGSRARREADALDRGADRHLGERQESVPRRDPDPYVCHGSQGPVTSTTPPTSGLKEAIEKKLFADLKDVVKITTSIKTPDAEQLKRINEVVERLISEQGYCPVCANELLKYVGTLLAR